MSDGKNVVAHFVLGINAAHSSYNALHSAFVPILETRSIELVKQSFA